MNFIKFKDIFQDYFMQHVLQYQDPLDEQDSMYFEQYFNQIILQDKNYNFEKDPFSLIILKAEHDIMFEKLYNYFLSIPEFRQRFNTIADVDIIQQKQDAQIENLNNKMDMLMNMMQSGV